MGGVTAAREVNLASPLRCVTHNPLLPAAAALTPCCFQGLWDASDSLMVVPKITRTRDERHPTRGREVRGSFLITFSRC